MKLFVFPILLLGVSDVLLSDASRILAILPVNSKSHFLMFEQIVKGLAKRGHHVDVVSHFPRKKLIPNYHDIVSFAGLLPDITNNVTMDTVEKALSKSLLRVMTLEYGNEICEFLGHPTIEELITNPPRDKPYDLVISQAYASHCFMAFGHHLKVPVVGVSTTVLYPWMNGLVGNPDNPSYIPNALQGYVRLGNFWERLQNTVYTITDKFWYNYYTSPQDAIVKKFFGPDAPGVRELERSVALLLVNSHYTLNGVKPQTPAVVEIGGIHVNEDGPEISPDLKKWLDESTDGFVYFTLGSMVQIETFPKKVLLSLYASFAKIAPIRVLMKIVNKDDLPPGLPENILTLPWMPQYKILKHRNIRAFITHGGLMSAQEAIVCGVPLIGIPLFVDQYLNINFFVEKKIAIRLNFRKISVKKLDTALNKILKDPSYRREIRKLSAQFLDRPMSAVDTATFWIEYVIRNGPNALRSPILDLTWWQAALIDVYGTLFLAVLLLAFVLKTTFEKIIALISERGDEEVSQLKKKA